MIVWYRIEIINEVLVRYVWRKQGEYLWNTGGIISLAILRLRVGQENYDAFLKGARLLGTSTSYLKRFEDRNKRFWKLYRSSRSITHWDQIPLSVVELR